MTLCGRLALTTVLLTAGIAPVAAHHSFAAFDREERDHADRGGEGSAVE